MERIKQNRLEAFFEGFHHNSDCMMWMPIAEAEGRYPLDDDDWVKLGKDPLR